MTARYTRTSWEDPASPSSCFSSVSSFWLSQKPTARTLDQYSPSRPAQRTNALSLPPEKRLGRVLPIRRSCLISDWSAVSSDKGWLGILRKIQLASDINSGILPSRKGSHLGRVRTRCSIRTFGRSLDHSAFINRRKIISVIRITGISKATRGGRERGVRRRNTHPRLGTV